MNKNMVTLLASLAQTRSQNIAYQYFYDEAQPSKTLSYGELHQRSASIADALSEYFTPGDRALLLYNSGFEFIEAFFACLYAGIIAVPVYPPKKNQNVERLRSIIEDAGAKGALTSEKISEIAQPLLASEPSLAELSLFTTDNIKTRHIASTWPLPDIEGEQLAFLQYTSGSTGAPKGVMVSHNNIIDNQELMKQAFGHDSTTPIVSWLPHFHDMGLIFGIMHPIYIGACASLMNPAYFLQKPLRWLQLLSKTQAYTSSAPNFAYDLCVDTIKDDDLKELDLSHWRSALNGAEPVRASTLERFYQKFKVCGLRRESIAPCYGMAETTLFATGGQLLARPTILPLDPLPLQQGKAIEVETQSTNKQAFYAVNRAESEQPYYAVSSGRCWGAHRIAIVNPNTCIACDDGETGEIWISGPSVAKGYWNNSSATESTFHATLQGEGNTHYLRTGDLGFIHQEELFVTGRAKDVLIFRGKNYYPQDIELTVSEAHESLEQNGGAAFAITLPDGEERLVIVQQVKRTALRKLDAQAVLQQVTAAIVQQHGITAYDIVLIKPGRIHKTSSGKIQRQENKRCYLAGNFAVVARLREEVKPSPSAPVKSAVATKKIERLLQQLVAQEVEKPAASLEVDTPFLALGVDSMKAVRISGELMELHDLDLEPTILYEYPSITELAGYLSQFEQLTQQLGEAKGDDCAAAKQKSSGEAQPSQQRVSSDDIAVIGMACRYPQADGLAAFWQLLCEQGDAITSPDPVRLQLCPELQENRLGGYLSHIDRFDAALFGISPQEAKHIDPQHRLLLQSCYHAMQHAGYQPAALAGKDIGVYVGISQNDYFLLSQQYSKSSAYLGTGTALSIAANRLSYTFNFNGPSVAIDTACSSSLVALHHAMQALRHGETSAALVAGVNLILTDDVTTACENAQMLAADGHCKTFSEDADGYVRSEGVGVVMLKPLKQALADCDPIVAVLQGSAINQDGRSNGITAPNSAAQQAVVQRALDNANMRASQIQFVETHGTGTELGDPIEVTGLNRIYGAQHDDSDPLLLGAVKANIGHLESAAGIAGLIKTLLCLQHKQIPGQRYSERLNSHIPWQSLPFQVPSTTQAWPQPKGSKRAAGISSFGFGGSNAHVICTEAPELEKASRETNTPLCYLLPLIAKSRQSLQDLAQRYQQQLSQLDDGDFVDLLAQTAKQAQLKGQRLTIAASSRGELLQQLQQPIMNTYTTANSAPQVVYLFTGQGAQYVAMAKSLYQSQAVFRAALDEVDDLLGERFGKRLLTVLYQACHESELQQTLWTQVSLFAIEYAQARLLQSFGIVPEQLLSHSVGEYAAACIAGVFSLAEAVELIACRGQLMHQLSEAGCMVAARCSDTQAQQLLTENQATRVVISAFHGEAGVVFSGAEEEMRRLTATLEREQIKHTQLHTAKAFHSPLMTPMLADFKAVAGKVNFKRPNITFVSSVTGQIECERIACADYWVEQITQPVQFVSSISALASLEHALAIELGPKPVLSGLIQENCESKALHFTHILQDKGSDTLRFAQALGLFVDLGGQLDWQQIYADLPAQRQALPLYPFDAQSYWISTVEVREPNVALSGVPEQDRDGQIKSFVINTLAGLLAMPVDAIETDLPLLEMGVDSLMIMQAVRVYEREFGLDFSVRQFYQELSSVDKLVAYIQAHSDYLRQPQAQTVNEVQPSASIEQAQTTTDNDLVRIYQAQLQAASQITQSEAKAALEAVVKQQLAHLQGHIITATPPTASAPAEPPEQRQSVLPGAQQKQLQAVHSSASVRQHLAQLSEQHTRKTTLSKQRVEQYRPFLADCRASAGFRLSSKEMLYPIFSKRCEGAYIWDIDDNRYIDITMDFGTNLFGHNPEFIKQALAAQLDAGMQLGLASPDAPEVARLICELTGLQRACFCNSGTEAVMTALRLARSVTKRDKVVQFSGAYHGHYDGTLATAAEEQGVEPMCLGVQQGAIANNLVLPYADESALATIAAQAEEIAAVLVEPVQSRHPEKQPWAFLRQLRALTERHGIALIFDEMITGFRAHPGGVQALLGIQADIATYGKVVGGGMPIGVVAGSSRYLDAIDGGVWQYGDDSFPQTDTTFFAGTFCKHPMTMASAKAVLQAIKARGTELQTELNEKTQDLKTQLNGFFVQQEIPIRIVAFSSLFRFQFSQNLDVFFYEMQQRGVFIWEGRNCFLSAAHSDEDIAAIIAAVKASAMSLKQAGYFGESNANTQQSSYPLSLAQQQLLALALTSSEGAKAYQLQANLKLSGALDLKRLRQAIQRTGRDHPILTFGVDSDALMQCQRCSELALESQVLAPGSTEKEVIKQLTEIRYQTFALEQDPLCKVVLLSDMQQRHYLSIVAHHLICDGLSLQLVIAQIAHYYSEPEASVAQAKSVAYRDYVEQLARYPETAAAKQDQVFWQQQLADAMPLALPQKVQPEPESYRVGQLQLDIPARSMNNLEALGRHLRCGQFATLLGLYCMWLHKLSGQQVVSVGVPVSDRQRLAGEYSPELLDTQLVGYCTNILPLVVDFSSLSQVADLLQQVQQQLLDAFDHQEYPFAMLTGTEQVLPETLFNLDKVAALPEFSDLAVEAVPSVAHYGQFQLVTNLTCIAGQWSLLVEYQTSSLDADMISQYCQQFIHLLARVDANTAIAEQSALMLSQDDIHRVLEEPMTQLGEVKATDFITRLQHNALQYADHTALIMDDSSLSYAVLNRKVNQLAHYLLAQQLAPNSIVAVAMPRRPELLITLLAIMKVGATFLPLDLAFPAARIQAVLSDAAAALVICDASSIDSEVLAQGQYQCLCIDSQGEQIASCAEHDPNVALEGSQRAYLIYTSGSTGNPKGVAISHSALANLLHAMSQMPGINSTDRLLATTTVAFDIALLELFGPLLVGATVVLASEQSSSDPEALAAILQQQNITLMQATPTLWQLLMQTAPACIEGVRVLCGGEPLTTPLAQQLIAEGEALYNLYGPTETTIWSAVARITDGHDITIGQAIDNSALFVLPEQYQSPCLPLPEGVWGELYIAGSGVALGYHNRAPLTEARFVQHQFTPELNCKLYRTGDKARRLADGRFELKGRLDHQVKHHGHRIELGDIQHHLTALLDNADVEVVLQRLPTGPALCAYIVADGSHSAEDRASSLRDALAAQLPSYMVPEHFVWLQQWPVTANGKRDRRALPLPAAQAVAAKPPQSPRNDTERQTQQHYLALLPVTQLSVDERFVDCGGNSVLGMQLVSRLNRAFNVRLTIGDIFEHGSVAALATCIATLQQAQQAIAAEQCTPEVEKVSDVTSDRDLSTALSDKSMTEMDL